MSVTLASPGKAPAHVPRQLYWDHNISEFPAQFEDPYVGFAEAMHQGPDIVWALGGAHTGKPGWLLTRFDHMQEAITTFAKFTAADNRTISDLLGMELPMLPQESDPPIHRHYRLLIQPWFQPSVISALDSKIRQICVELIGKFERRDGCDFVTEFSSLLPSYIFLEMMGMPRELLPQFLAWEHAFLRGETLEIKTEAAHSIYDYLRRYCEEKRRNPGDDLVSKIVVGEVEGRKLTEIEAVGMCITLYAGGLDTVTNSLGWQFRHLARDQTLQMRLRNDPELIPMAAEEFLRAYAVTNNRRTVAEDMEFHGVAMHKGDIVAIPTFLACRDPREYSNPHAMDLERKQRFLTFGMGNHHCIGVHLAKREIRIVLSEFLSRFRNIRLPEGQSPTLTTQRVWGVKNLPLVWDA